MTVRHPLQPFDPRNFEPGALGAPEPFSFDQARPARRPRGGRRTAEPPPAIFDPDAAAGGRRRPRLVELTDLIRFFAHPVRALLRDRGGLLPAGATTSSPTSRSRPTLAGLERWAVGDRLLRLHLQGARPEPARATPSGGAARSRRGASAPRPWTTLTDEVDGGGRRWPRRSWTRTPERHEVDALLPGERPAHRHRRPRLYGEHLVRVGFSRLSREAPAGGLARAAGPDRRPIPTGPGGPSPSGRGGRSVLGPVDADLGRPRCWPTWSTCAGPGCASRCPFAAADLGRVRPDPFASQPLARSSSCATWTRPGTRTATPSTSGSSAPGSRLDGLLARAVTAGGGARHARRAEPVRHPGPAGLHPLLQLRGADVSDRDRRTARADFDVCGPLPSGHHRAGGQRRHRARRTRSPPWPPATSPRARSSWTS